MRREQERLDSFQAWTLSIITPGELAKAGFYYVGKKPRPLALNRAPDGELSILPKNKGFR
jgi:hypothetical protein